MFRKTSTIYSIVSSSVSPTKKAARLFSPRNFSTEIEPGKKVRSEVDLLRSDISSIRYITSEIKTVTSDIASLRTDLASVKADIAEIKTDLSNFKEDNNRQFAEVHKQASNNVRIILAGMFGISTATVAATQFLNSKKDEITSLLTLKKP
jgi:gas vesicle protein